MRRLRFASFIAGFDFPSSSVTFEANFDVGLVLDNLSAQFQHVPPL